MLSVYLSTNIKGRLRTGNETGIPCRVRAQLQTPKRATTPLNEP